MRVTRLLWCCGGRDILCHLTCLFFEQFSFLFFLLMYERKQIMEVNKRSMSRPDGATAEISAILKSTTLVAIYTDQ